MVDGLGKPGWMNGRMGEENDLTKRYHYWTRELTDRDDALGQSWLIILPEFILPLPPI